jgi:hypothetical protein
MAKKKNLWIYNKIICDFLKIATTAILNYPELMIVRNECFHI